MRGHDEGAAAELVCDDVTGKVARDRIESRERLVEQHRVSGGHERPRELDADVAPVTVANFAKLAGEGFYDGLTFHRIIEGFMVQGGDPNGNGTGGSDEKIVGEFSDNGHPNSISHVRGTISMARSQAYNSASSQFFIMQADTPSLDGQYAAFGHVTEGMDVVDAMCEAARPTDNNGTIAAADQPRIASVKMDD